MHHITRILYLALCVSGLVSGTGAAPGAATESEPGTDTDTVSGTDGKERAFPAAPERAGSGKATTPAEEAGTANAITLRTDQIDQAEALVAGHDTVVLPMQNEDGSLNYVSRLPLAVESGASWGDPARNQRLRALNERGELHTVAEISCLRDQLLIQNDPALSLRRVSGSPWRDGAGYGWLDPAERRVEAYLIGVCRELADLGFDEIVLTHCAYPTEGAVECLRPLGDKTGALEKLLRQLQGAVADWETEISLRACADADEPDSASGQTEALLAIADAVLSE